MFRYTQATLILEIVTILAVLVLLAPFWILIVGAFKTGYQIPDSSSFAPPAHPTLEQLRHLAVALGAASPETSGRACCPAW